MGIAVYGLAVVLKPFLVRGQIVSEIVALGALVGFGLAFFALLVQLSGAVDLRRVFGVVIRRA
jgi:hypothetical protein